MLTIKLNRKKTKVKLYNQQQGNDNGKKTVKMSFTDFHRQLIRQSLVSKRRGGIQFSLYMYVYLAAQACMTNHVERSVKISA